MNIEYFEKEIATLKLKCSKDKYADIDNEVKLLQLQIQLAIMATIEDRLSEIVAAL